MANRGEILEEKLEDLKLQERENISTNHHHVDLDHETYTRPGAQLSDKQTFTNKKGQTISGYPVIVDFRRLLQLSIGHSEELQKEQGIIQGVAKFMMK
jgi:hypothetical protein